MLGAAVILLAVNAVAAEYHYKLRGPPAPPIPPHSPSRIYSGSSSSFGKIKWRPPLIRGPHLHHHSPPPHFQYRGPPHHSIVRLPVHQHHHKPSVIPLSIAGPSWESSPGFRAPVHKEQFSPSPLTDFEYQVAKPSPVSQSPLVLQAPSDDDKGPIHTIPAPNLSLSGKPYATSSSLPQSSTVYGKHTEQGSLTLQGPDISGLPIRNNFESLASPGLTLQHTHGYEVHEESNDQAGYTLDGQPAYYAPDPDPSLPAPRVPATIDPQSFPSNGKTPAELLILQQPTKPAPEIDPAVSVNALTSQDLLQLLHGVSPHGHQLVDNYGVPLLQQPQLQQHLLQQASLGHQLVDSHQGDNSLILKAIRDEINPQFHNFNYQEQYQEGISRDYSVVEDQEPEGAEASPVSTELRKPPGGHFKATSQRTSNNIQDVHAAKENTEQDPTNDNKTERNVAASTLYPQFNKAANGVFSTPFYTTVPSRQVAEKLASLASAGIANKRNNELKSNSINSNKENTSVSNDNTKKDSAIENDKEIRIYETTYSESSQVGGNRIQEDQDSNVTPGEVVEYVEYEDGPVDGDYDENKPDEDEQQEITKQHPEFGTRIRPKRTIS